MRSTSPGVLASRHLEENRCTLPSAAANSTSQFQVNLHIGRPTSTFFISHNFSCNYVRMFSKLSSDHLPIVLFISSFIEQIKIEPRLTNESTNWAKYRESVDALIPSGEQIDSSAQLDEAAERFATILTTSAKLVTKFENSSQNLILTLMRSGNQLNKRGVCDVNG